MPKTPLTIGRVAALVGLTVRALHHYDDIGLVSASYRSAAGYRLYTDDDLRRLQQVLLFRELGFSLDAVRDLIDAPPERRRDALIAQRAVLEQRRRHAESVLKAVDATLHSLEASTPMNTEHLFDGYDTFQNGEYVEEARQRWGGSESWATSQRRTRAYSRDDWSRIQSEADAITRDFHDAMQRGEAHDSDTAMTIAERHRMHIDRYFYPCSHTMHVNVAALYTADPRFQAHYDRHADGLAAYIEAAVQANAARSGAG